MARSFAAALLYDTLRAASSFSLGLATQSPAQQPQEPRLSAVHSPDQHRLPPSASAPLSGHARSPLSYPSGPRALPHGTGPADGSPAGPYDGPVSPPLDHTLSGLASTLSGNHSARPALTSPGVQKAGPRLQQARHGNGSPAVPVDRAASVSGVPAERRWPRLARQGSQQLRPSFSGLPPMPRPTHVARRRPDLATLHSEGGSGAGGGGGGGGGVEGGASARPTSLYGSVALPHCTARNSTGGAPQPFLQCQVRTHPASQQQQQHLPDRAISEIEALPQEPAPQSSLGGQSSSVALGSQSRSQSHSHTNSRSLSHSQPGYPTAPPNARLPRSPPLLPLTVRQQLISVGGTAVAPGAHATASPSAYAPLSAVGSPAGRLSEPHSPWAGLDEDPGLEAGAHRDSACDRDSGSDTRLSSRGPWPGPQAGAQLRLQQQLRDSAHHLAMLRQHPQDHHQQQGGGQGSPGCGQGRQALSSLRERRSLRLLLSCFTCGGTAGPCGDGSLGAGRGCGLGLGCRGSSVWVGATRRRLTSHGGTTAGGVARAADAGEQVQLFRCVGAGVTGVVRIRKPFGHRCTPCVPSSWGCPCVVEPVGPL